MATDPELLARLKQQAEAFRYRVLAERHELIESAEGFQLVLTWEDGSTNKVGPPIPAAEQLAWLDDALGGMGWLEEGRMNYMNYPDFESVVLLLSGIREEEEWYQEREGTRSSELDDEPDNDA